MFVVALVAFAAYQVLKMTRKRLNVSKGSVLPTWVAHVPVRRDMESEANSLTGTLLRFMGIGLPRKGGYVPSVGHTSSHVR